MLGGGAGVCMGNLCAFLAKKKKKLSIIKVKRWKNTERKVLVPSIHNLKRFIPKQLVCLKNSLFMVEPWREAISYEVCF